MSSAKYCAAITLLSALLSACDSTSLDVANSDNNSATDAGVTIPGEIDGNGEIDGSTEIAGSDVVQDDEYWAQLAQNYTAFVVPPEIGAARDESENINLGRWGELIEWPQIAAGAAHLPDGRLLTWSSSKVNNFGGATAFTHGSIFDPLTETFTDMPNQNQNMFCAGVSMLADGSVFTPGGGAIITTTSIFDGNSWSLTDPLNTARWYPQSTTLPSGQVLTSLGSMTSAYSELWTKGEGWNTLPTANLQLVRDDTSAPSNQRTWFPALNVAPDGSLFHPGPTSGLFSLDLYTNGAPIIPHGKRESGDPHRLYNTTVMYDVGKMLVAGGGQPALNTAMTIDINGSTPVITATEPMTYARSMQDSIVLPDGKVLVIGGNSSGIQFSDEGTQLFPEMWDPQTGQWETLAPHSRPRNYHSTAMLLKDGRVAAMGSGLCGNCATNQQNGEIFEPPYLFNPDGTRASRPELTAGPPAATAGQALTFSATAGIQSFSMLRLVALTHHHTTDQRYIPIGFSEVSAGNYNLQLPSNSNVLIPGYYWVFGLDANGVPSEGHTILINPTATEVPEPPTYISYEYYEGRWNSLPDFNSLTPVATGELTTFSLHEAQVNDNFAFRYTATLELTQEGSYTFFTNSDDGSQLFINGVLVVDNDGVHATTEKQGTINLGVGRHEIVVTYFERSVGSNLAVQMQGPFITKQTLQSFLVPLDEVDNGQTNPQPPAQSNEAVISYNYYEGNWSALPEFSTLTPVASGELTEFTDSPRQQNQFYGFRYTTTLYVPEADEYTFYTVSDDGSALYVNGQLVVDNDGLHSTRERQGSINLPQGEHDIVVEYFNRAGRATFEVLYESSSISKQVLAPSLAPIIDPTDPENPDNLVSNGGFSSDLSAWASCGGQTAFSGGTAVLSSGGCLFQEFSITEQATYTLTCDAAATSGFASVQLTVSDASFASIAADLVPVTSSATAPVVATVTATGSSAQGVVTLYAADQASFDNCVVLEDLSTTVPTAAAPAANELLTNASFDNNLDGWFGCGGEQALSTDGVDGGQAVNLTNGGCLFQEFVMTPGLEYGLSCVGKATTGFASVSFIEYDSTFTELSSQEQEVLGNVYQLNEMSITASDNAQIGAVTLYGETDATFDSCGVVVTGGVVATAVPVIPVNSPDNLISNGDFSNNGTDWLSCGGSTEIDTVGTDNSNAVTLGTTSCVFQEFAATPGREYGLSCAGSASAFASMSVSFSDIQFTELLSNSVTIPSAALSPIYVEETAPTNTARGAVTLYADESAIFDDCAVVEL